MNTRNIRFRSNRVRDILSLYHEELDPLYGPGEVAAFGEMLFEAFLGWDRVKLLTSKDHTVNQSDLLRLHWALEDLRRHRPIQHIIGHVDFCGCRIAVSPDVLIPRPETEEMVDFLVESGEWRVESGERRVENGEWRVESGEWKAENGEWRTENGEWRTENGERRVENGERRTKSHRGQALSTLRSPLSTPRVLDLCTGSGCIAIALKKAFSGADVTAVDISPAALAIARQNALENAAEVNFVQSDILATPKEENKEENKEKNREEKNFNFQFSIFNLIVSNPPYVRQSERAAMQRNVLDYEPPLALFVPDDDPLRFYRAIAAIAARCLAPRGLLALEINEALAADTCALLARYGFAAAVHRDFRGRDRFLTATR